ncbi:hypothetical protein PoB_006949500 [Plakobranchus ocellatus]|uniref:Uncharacterized protein n=1 Tax=Plakobranchus ocellatus TaxID=259542 RepID=A0AAV4DG47_9GAST|nr:hypothetical protein PoB_006949500 [Plakobranchus ocellatus]
MGRSWRWPPVRHHIAEHTSACARSPWTSHPRYDKASPASNQADQKLIHMTVYPGIIMGGTTLDPKHNARKRTLTECVDHGRFTGSRHRWSSEASSYANHFDRHSNIMCNTYINSYRKRDLPR